MYHSTSHDWWSYYSYCRSEGHSHSLRSSLDRASSIGISMDSLRIRSDIHSRSLDSLPWSIRLVSWNIYANISQRSRWSKQLWVWCSWAYSSSLSIVMSDSSIRLSLSSRSLWEHSSQRSTHSSQGKQGRRSAKSWDTILLLSVLPVSSVHSSSGHSMQRVTHSHSLSLLGSHLDSSSSRWWDWGSRSKMKNKKTANWQFFCWITTQTSSSSLSHHRRWFQRWVTHRSWVRGRTARNYIEQYLQCSISYPSELQERKTTVW